jgi:trimeric autotransporter adhesin
VVVGGGYNLASGPWSFIGGGGRETGSGSAGTSAEDHIAAGKWATIGGGKGNRAGTGAVHTGATVAGGEQNQAVNIDATVAGGTLNVASAQFASVGGGQSNLANNTGAAVAGGSGNTASGLYAAVPGGLSNTASGSYAFAAGRQAKATHAGSLLLADSSAFDFNSAAANEFAVRAVGGTRVITAISGTGVPTAGVTIAAGGGSWSTLSDRAAKDDLTAVDGDAVLARLVAMPVYTWRYKTEQSGALHMGPTAQDFHAAFGLGDSDKHITTVDADGIALAAIKALHARLVRSDATLAAQDAELGMLEGRLAAVESVESDVALMKATLARLLKQRAVTGVPVVLSR